MVGAILDEAIDQRFMAYVRQEELMPVFDRLDRLEEENARLQAEVVDFQREIYKVKDLVEVMGLEQNTIVKNYIRTGRIKATKPVKEYEIAREEYLRVVRIVKTFGKEHL